MNRFFQDVHFALRQLWRKPGFALTCVLILALGIAANVTIFSAVNGFILRPLLVPHPEQVAVLAGEQQGAPLGVYFLSYAELADFRKQADVFSDLFASEVTLSGMSADKQADHFVGSYVTGNYFSGLGVKPVLGRLFAPGEGEQPGSEAHVVLGYPFWQKRFSGSRSVVGKQVLVDGKPATIIGVAPEGFHGTSFALNMDAYLPLSMKGVIDPSLWTARDDRQLVVMGRLKPDTSIAQAQSVVNVITVRLAGQYAATDKGLQVRVMSERMSRPVPLPNNLIMVISAVFLGLAVVVLLLACVNVANILLVRAIARDSEMAIRAALGASRTRLVTQVLIESLLLALLGAAFGIALGTWATHGIADIRLASFIPVNLDFGLDWRVLGYALAAALCTGLLVGIWPALRFARANIDQALREGGRSGTPGAARQRVRRILAGAQIAASLMLLIIAGLFTRSLQRVQRMYLGFEPDHLLNVVLDPHEIGYDEARTKAFYRELQEHVRALPGVVSASLAFSLPLGNYNTGEAVNIEGHPTPVGQQPPMILNNYVDSAYFETMKIPLLRGRTFIDSDDENAPNVAIINQTMAQRFWPDEDPLGKRLQAQGKFWQVVGIAENGKYAFAGEDARPYFYLPMKQSFVSMRTLQLRTSIEPEALIGPLHQAIQDLEPDLPVFSLRTMQESLLGANGFMIFRVGALLSSAIGVLGLILSTVGVYGVIAFAASQRTREIGVRIAMGATPSQVLKLVLRQGVWVVLAGAALGLLLTIGVSRGIANLLVGVSATDPLTLVAATVFLTAVALYACYVPARRAAKVDPMVALRYE